MLGRVNTVGHDCEKKSYYVFSYYVKNILSNA